MLIKSLKNKYRSLSLIEKFFSISVLTYLSWNLFYNFILLDLGFSSIQLADSNIGLSFKKNSNLNMNYLGGDLNAYKIINYYDKDELKRVFNLYGEINQAEKLAKYIVNQRSLKKIFFPFDEV